MSDSAVEICPKCFKRGVLKEKDGVKVFEHNFQIDDPTTGAVTFKFVYHSVDSIDTEEPK